MNASMLALKRISFAIIFAVSCFPAFSQVNELKAVSDTIDLYPGVPVVFNILANDSIPAGSYIKSISAGGANHVQCERTHDSAWNWTFKFFVPSWGYGGDLHSGYFMIAMPFDTCTGHILYRIHDKSYSYLEINNVRARFSSSGNHFFNENADYEVPKGSGKTSLFSNALWIGGKDAQGHLHLAAERYGQGPYTSPAHTKHDFYSGPVMDSSKYSIYTDTVWNYIWNLKKSDIDYHKAHFTDPGYVPLHDILTWPGNGDVASGIAPQLAPFYDANEDGVYNAYAGDYPEIRGDQALFFIFNDDRGLHLESMGAKLRIEIHGMAYAFDMPEDSALKNTVFLNYKIFNRSHTTYDSLLIGTFTDIDLGYPMDDYVGCDVERSMYFGYNGTPVDGTGQTYAYGANPPTQSVTLLAGPYMASDGIDNPRFTTNGIQLCDFSVNGVNFGDSIADNERYGLQGFAYINNNGSGVPGYMTDPDFDFDYYQLLCGKWKDGTPMMYGGNGHLMTGGYGPECRFMFPGESDTLDWGIGCVPPNGPKNWTEETAFNNPSDRRGVGVTGPISFHPGEVQDIDIAFSWARDYAGKTPMGSVAKLREMTDIIRKAFTTNRLSNGNPFFYGVNDHAVPAGIPLHIFPNPASDYLDIAITGSQKKTGATIELMTMQGKCVQTTIATVSTSPIRLYLSEIPAGLYLIRVTTGETVTVKTVVVSR